MEHATIESNALRSSGQDDFMTQAQKLRFTHTDIDLMRARMKLTLGQRLQVMLDGHVLLVGITRSRLRGRYPALSDRDLNLKVIEDIKRVKRLPSRSHTVSRHPT
jgi:hypothetical protein